MMQNATEAARSQTVSLSARAAHHIATLVEAEALPATRLRIGVSGGGCSGFRYDFSLDATLHDDDRIFERDGAALVIDETSLSLLGGSELDYVENLAGASFQIHNPQAQSSCGCGSSFSLG